MRHPPACPEIERSFGFLDAKYACSCWHAHVIGFTTSQDLVCRQTRATNKLRHLYGQVTGEVPLHRRSRVGIGVEIPLEGVDVPTNCADRKLYHGLDLGRKTVEDECGTHQLTRPQEPDDLALLRHPDRTADNEPHC